jgi:hypothetical protein
MLNSNAIHNILNVANIGLGALTGGLLATGCSTLANGMLDCSHSWINPTYTGGAIAVISVVKLGMNIVRDGLGGLLSPQPPVTK